MPVVVFFPVHELTYAVLDSFRVAMFSYISHTYTLSEMDTNREKGGKRKNLESFAVEGEG